MALYQSSQIPSLNHPERTHVASCQERMPESSSKTETLELICPFPELSSPNHHPHWPPVMCLKCKTNHATLELNILRWLPITFTRKSTFTWSARPFMIWPLPTLLCLVYQNVLPCSLQRPPMLSSTSSHALFMLVGRTTLPTPLKALTHLCSLVLCTTPFPSISVQLTPIQPSKLSSAIPSLESSHQHDCVHPLCSSEDSHSKPGGPSVWAVMIWVTGSFGAA